MAFQSQQPVATAAVADRMIAVKMKKLMKMAAGRFRNLMAGVSLLGRVWSVRYMEKQNVQRPLKEYWEGFITLSSQVL